MKKLKGTPVAEIEECLETREIVAVNTLVIVLNQPISHQKL
jgi:hypothetical protein